jgi:taurine dioxygenase
MAMNGIGIRRLGYALGAEITGVDLTKPVDPAKIDSIKGAWAKHLVLIFPEQNLSPDQLIAFSRNFGTLDRNDATPRYRHPKHHEIFVVSTRPVDGRPSETRNTGRNWHSDLSTTLAPPLGSLLHCRELPDIGGDTMFANMYSAYERLSPTLRGFLDTLWAVHDLSLVTDLAKRNPRQYAEMLQLSPPIAHPVVRKIAETGRKSLFISQRVRQFVGMTEEESQPLLRFLCDQATQPEFCYRHVWQKHDLLMRDNRATLHVALPDYDMSQVRHMFRTTVLGEKTGRAYGGIEQISVAAAG